MKFPKIDKDVWLFILVSAMLVVSILLLGWLAYRFVDLDAQCKSCEHQKQYYIDQLVEGNTRIARADSILKAHGIFNPKDTTWQKSK